MTAPPDQSVRVEVRDRLDATMFLEAGAGSGKTSCLVDRFVALVEDGVPADAIAAITFTEAAAGELGDRVRRELQRRAAHGSDRCRAALDVLDGAAISTLHAFAQRILVAHPLEAGVPPRLEVLDEITSEVAFQRRWEVFLDGLLDDPELERPIRLLAAQDRLLDPLRDLALAFSANWDLVARMKPSEITIPDLALEEWCRGVDAAAALRTETSDDDGMHKRLGELEGLAQRLREANDEDEAFRLFAKEAPSFKVDRCGNKQKWRSADALAEARRRVTALGAEHERICAAVLQACVCRLADAVAAFTLAHARERRREGRLEFHDLLVLARDVLRDGDHGIAVRAALRDRYQRLLLDEFQDTDPIQLEIAVLIASGDPDAGEKHWRDVEVEPGRLFFVGDPKQSIYRFRRADIATFLAARDALVDEPRQLTANFRTGPGILRWVNATFAALISEVPGSQPAYVDLVGVRQPPQVGPAVAFVGSVEHEDKPDADTLREREALDVADAVRRAVEEGWSVEDDDGWRAAQWRDICILLPARTSLPALERALQAAEVPYRAETSSLVYGTREVRDLLAVARAVDDPTDELSLVAALRSPAFGCGDDDLYSWRVVHRGRWDHQRPLPEGAPPDHPVALAMAWLRAAHRESAWRSASEVLARIVRDRRLLQIAFASPRPHDVLRRVRFVLDQARAWEESGGGSLRDYLTWVERQSLESSRVVETVLPETDDDSVRILTVHGAKGLEFPITVLSGMTTQMKGRRRGVEVSFPPDAKTWAVRLNGSAATDDWEAWKPIDEQLDEHERKRLLYVAATRARDHLVVSVHRKQRNGDPTAAWLLWEHGGAVDDVAHLERRPEARTSGTGAGPARATPARLLPAKADWRAERNAALARAARRVSISATRIAEEAAAIPVDSDPGLAKDGRDLDLPPWQKGRYGTAIGRAVHAALQVVDLETGAGLDDAARAQAAAEGVSGYEATIAALCRTALASPAVRAAAQAQRWRELYVGMPVGDVVVEGYIDLVYRADGGLVVVDYKTDGWRNERELDAKVARYQPQLSVYADALEHVAGEPVVDIVLVFLANGGAERHVERVLLLV